MRNAAKRADDQKGKPMAKSTNHDSARGRTGVAKLRAFLREFANPLELVAKTQCGPLYGEEEINEEEL